MARNAATFAKRMREAERQRKRKDKLQRRAERTQNRGQPHPAVETTPEGVDPDIAHIKPGPQPKPWLDDEDEELPSHTGRG